MYHGPGDPRSARRSLDMPAGFSPEATARVVLARVRKLLDDHTPGLPVERGLPDALAVTLNDPALERERLFLLGWLHWLNDDPAAAELLLAEAMHRACEENAIEALAESAYWGARVRLLLGRGEALTKFESVLRTLGGSPRATAWFVDLLGRAGRIDRAEQVWKSVRGNRRVAGCAEGPLLEARMLLRHGEITAAERLLSEVKPTSGVVWVEHRLLLAWIAVTQKQHDKGRDLLRQAREDRIRRRHCKPGRRWSSNEFEANRPATKGRGACLRHCGTICAASRLAWRDKRNRGSRRIAPRWGVRLRSRSRATHWRVWVRTISPRCSPASRVCFSPCAAGRGWLWNAFVGARPARRNTLTSCSKPPSPATRTPPPNTSATSPRPCNSSSPIRLSCASSGASPNTDAAARNAFRAALELAVRRLPPAAARELFLEWSKAR